jgi:hypothetical protein
MLGYIQCNKNAKKVSSKAVKEIKMKYEEFEKAVEVMQLCTKVTFSDLQFRYRELSKIYHPDMPTGDAAKFDELAKAYKLLKEYMLGYKFSFDEEEFKEQYPSILNMEDWLSGRTQ